MATDCSLRDVISALILAGSGYAGTTPRPWRTPLANQWDRSTEGGSGLLWRDARRRAGVECASAGALMLMTSNPQPLPVHIR